MSYNLQQLFQSIDKDYSGTIDVIELHRFLCQGNILFYKL